MTSPNEPGYSRATEGGGNGSDSGPGPEGGSVGGAASRGPLPGGPSPERTADATEVPPWQRGRAAKPANRTPEAAGRSDAPPRPDAPRHQNSGATSHSPGIDARLNRFLSNIPLGRIGLATEIAGPAVFLASGMASYVNGVTLLVDGGAQA